MQLTDLITAGDINAALDKVKKGESRSEQIERLSPIINAIAASARGSKYGHVWDLAHVGTAIILIDDAIAARVAEVVPK